MQEHGGNMFLLDFLFHPELVEGCVKSQIPIETSGTKGRVVVPRTTLNNLINCFSFLYFYTNIQHANPLH